MTVTTPALLTAQAVSGQGAFVAIAPVSSAVAIGIAARRLQRYGCRRLMLLLAVII